MISRMFLFLSLLPPPGEPGEGRKENLEIFSFSAAAGSARAGEKEKKEGKS